MVIPEARPAATARGEERDCPIGVETPANQKATKVRVTTAMAKNPDDRYQTPEDVVRALSPWVEGALAPTQPELDVRQEKSPPPAPTPSIAAVTVIEKKVASSPEPAAVLDQMPTRPLDHATADRVARRQVLVIPHPTPVPIEVADHPPERLAA